MKKARLVKRAEFEARQQTAATATTAAAVKQPITRWDVQRKQQSTQTAQVRARENFRTLFNS